MYIKNDQELYVIILKKIKNIDFSYLGVVVLAVALYIGFDDLILTSSSETVRETLNAAIGVIFVIITTMYMLKKQSDVEQSKALGKEVFTKKLITYENAIEKWENICFSQTAVTEAQFATALNVHTSLCMIAPADVVETSGKVLTLIQSAYVNENDQQEPRAFAPDEKNTMCEYLGEFSKAVREDLSLPKTEMTQSFKDNFTAGFKEASLTATTARDMTKYSFRGATYGKGKLVHAVVKAIVIDKNIANIDKLKEFFPDDAWTNGRASKGKNAFVVELEANAKKSEKVRYFKKPEELIQLKNGDLIVVNSQWGTNFDYLFENFIKKNINDEIIPVKSNK